ncbi:hypothetical protein [Methanosarcina mazei]|uniref:Uncharacterized protein n=1 Tax=Methanosarcina mazei Tuc01 TaxID=1236903 RepID=M1Q6U4_METMZ|nr:hypothetical protein [Methanosarcina mazei]AGF95863.1 hypothetical protein MmTuc01_0424 [Methanosarcina mazei Tuc01]
MASHIWLYSQLYRNRFVACVSYSQNITLSLNITIFDYYDL